MKINELVFEKRKDLDESQVVFGKRFGLSHPAISDIERGVVRSLSFEMIEFIFKDKMPETPNQRIKALEAKVEKLWFLAGFRPESV